MTVFNHYDDVPRLRYGLIMADPPWKYSNWSVKGEKKNPSANYDCMPTEMISDLRVADLAAPDCAIWLWATNPMLPQALAVLGAWGFRYVTAGHWVKRTKHGKLQFGTGYCLRSAGEPFIIGAIGKPKYGKTVRSVIEAKVRQHSRKPDEAFAAAESLVPQAINRLELFGREERPGWDVMGDEVGKFDTAETCQ